MKKLLKQEWKFYIGAILLLSAILIGYTWLEGGVFSFRWENVAYDIPRLLRDICYIPMENIEISMVAYFIIRFYKYWTERKSCGREFLVTLPIKARTREIFYILADGAFVLVPNIIYSIVVYGYGFCSLSEMDVEIPWLLSAILPLAVVDIIYLLMLFAVARFIESLIVNGVWKIIGVIIAAALFFFSFSLAEDIFSLSKPTEAIYSFLMDYIYVDGRSYYGACVSEEEQDELISEYEKYERCIERIASKQVENDQQMKVTDWYNGEWSSGLTVLYKGKPIEQTFIERSSASEGEAYIMEVQQAAIDWVIYDFEMSNFGESGEIPKANAVYANLGFAILMLFLTVFLAGKRDYSKAMFYFSFVKYIFVVLIGFMIVAFGFGIGESEEQAIWQRILIVLSAICSAGLCSYYLTPDHSLRKRKE